MRNYWFKILFFSFAIGVLLYIALWIGHASQENPPLQNFTLSSITNAETPSNWLINYLPFVGMVSFIAANILLFLIELFFIEPSYAPSHDSSDFTRLMQHPIPSLSHLQDAFYVCPHLDIETIETELASQGIVTTTAAHNSWQTTSEKNS